MIGRLVLSDRNIYKIKYGAKQVSARKCNLLSSPNPDTLVKTSKEFSSRDEYIKFEPSTNSIIVGLGQVGTDVADLDIYYHLFTLNWLSSSKYMRLWEEYINECIRTNFDLSHNIGLSRTEYKNQVITIDPDKSIDLDDGFSFVSCEKFYQLDIHIADPISWFNFSDSKFKPIFDELTNRLQSCYISKTDRPEHPTHLLPPNIVNLVSLLEIKSSFPVKSRRALSFCFKISKDTKQIVGFELKPTELTNIVNYSYGMYDEFINSVFNIKKKTELVELVNTLVDIIGLNPLTYTPLTCSDDISHSMIEIFMILTNWWGGNYLLNTIKSNPILRTQNPNDLGSDFNISLVPEYARPFLSVSANYVNTFQSSLETEYTHYSLGISNYAHLSSPMRRFIDMVNHLGFYKQILDSPFDLEQINTKIKTQKKISNAWNLVKFIKSNPELNKFRACLFDWIKNDKNNKVIGLMVLYHQTNKFISIVNVELPQIDETLNLSKYMEWDVELYYNSNNFKSTKFPFSIKII
jgi:hypothetical protein